ncbi:MAG: ABC transporter substrate-binding protein [SAR324 cluster bacterium]|nr:ABC transporter substrate-binding protein [SAR324 cluster bacterium]
MIAALNFSVSAEDRPELVFAVDNLWQTMDPVAGISTSGGRVHSNVFDTLARRNFYEDEYGRKLVPHLATGWTKISPNIWRIEIRKGVKFHDGTEMTAEDVAFSMSEERIWAKKPLAPRGKRYARGMIRVEAVGPYTVEIETSSPDPKFPNRLVTPLGFVLPKAHYKKVGHDAFGQMPVGTGPYKVTYFDPSEKLTAVANDDYWNGKPPASKITWLIVPEYGTRYAGLAAGKFDIIFGIPADQEKVVSSTKGVRLLKQSIENYPMFAFNMLATKDLPNNPLQDANLRKAIVMGVDRDAITQALWGDATFTPAPFNFPEYGDYYDENRKARYSFNQERAREFLAKSSYKGEELEWHITRGFYPNYETAAEIMVEQWLEIGIKVKLTIVDNFGLAYKRPFHFLNMSMSSEFNGDPYRPLWMDWGPTSSRCCAKHKTWTPTDKFLEIGKAFEVETDFAKRKEGYLKLVEEWENVTPGMYLWRNVLTYAYRDKINWVTGASARTLFDHLHLQFK